MGMGGIIHSITLKIENICVSKIKLKIIKKDNEEKDNKVASRSLVAMLTKNTALVWSDMLNIEW